MTLEEIYKAYTAGFVDADGSIMFHRSTRNDNHIEIIVSIANSNREVLAWLRDLWGGSMTAEKTISSNHKTVYKLKLSTRKSINLLREIEPYMKVKKDRCLIALKYAETISRHYGAGGVPTDTLEIRENLFIELKRLNIRGNQATSPTGRGLKN